MENRYAEELIAVIAQFKRQQELNLKLTDELNGHLGAIAGQLEKIAGQLERLIPTKGGL
jgi:hypothetical protein